MATDNLLIEILGLRHPCLEVDELIVKRGQSWCIHGDTSSGLSVFLELLEGKLTGFSAQRLVFSPGLRVLSFAAQQMFYELELRNDDSDFLDRPDPGTLVRELLPNWQSHQDLLDSFGLTTLLDHGYRQLSSGQSRKLLLAERLLARPSCLVLENPYDGLDSSSRKELDRSLMSLATEQAAIILLVTLTTDIPRWCSHRASFNQAHPVRLEKNGDSSPRPSSRPDPRKTPNPLGNTLSPHSRAKRELIRLRNGFASYGTKQLFSGLDLGVASGDHTLITGPNGCGKSTLLEIITGDNPKCYANDLYLFGRKRGTGESIWDIKAKMGIVSPALHRDYRVAGSALQAVLSGYHDSIGLYQRTHADQIRSARKLLAWVGLDQAQNDQFRSLPYARQRLVLIARALIKTPELLILDEPTQGLDDHGRQLLLDFLDQAVADNRTTLLYVSHREDEYRPFFTQHIRLDSYGDQW
jgi:molybdate transport system ATP-binding protein